MRPTELQILLDISSAIATVRNKNDLFRLIVEKINPLFGFPKEAIIITIDQEERYYQLMFSESSFLPSAEVEAFKTQQFPIETPLRSILNSDQAVIIRTEPLIAAHPERPAAKIFKYLGVKELITTRLYVSGKAVGCFSLHSDKVNHFTTDQLPLFKSISDLVAVAVSNIVAGEEAALKEYEKSQLITISKHIANVRDKNDLFQLITNELKAFIPFDTAVISVLNEESNSFSVFLANAADTVRSQDLYPQAVTEIFPIEEGSLPWLVVRSAEPIVVDLEKAYFANPKIPYTKNAYRLGLREQMLTRLVHSGKVIGAIALLSAQQGIYTNKEKRTIQSLSNLFAIALNNILSNQELELRERQKSQLLNISAHITTIRNKDDLFYFIAEELKFFIPFDDMAILSVDEKNETFSVFLTDAGDTTKEHEDFPGALSQTYPLLKGTVPYTAFVSERPFIINVQEEYEKDPADYLRYPFQFGMKQEILGRLIHSGKVVGLVALLSKTTRYSEGDVEMLQSLSSLLAIAVNNILDREELLLREQHKTQLLKISSHIATIRDKSDLFHLIGNEVKSFILFDDLFIASVNEEKQTFSIFLADAGGSTKENKNYHQAVTQVHPLVKGTVPYKVYSAEKPFIIDIEEEYLKDHSDYMRCAYEFGMKQEMVARLMYSGKVIGLVGMLSKVKQYKEADTEILHSLSDLLAIALYNISANEEIQRRESQKSHLLKISRHIATIRQKEDLFRLIAEEMRSFIEFDDVVIALIDTEKQEYSVFLSDVTGITSKHKDYIRATSRTYPIKPGSLVQRIFQTSDLILIDIEHEYSKDPHSDSLMYAYSFGMREEIIVRLSYSGKTIGMMGILSKKRNRYLQADLETAHSLSSLVAIALNNILANEELKRREQQKSQLLNISTHIATMRDKNDLFLLITKEVRSFINFDDAIISVVDEKLESFKVFVSDMARETSEHKDYEQANKKTYPLTRGNIAHQVLQSEKPMIIDIKKEMFKNPELEFLKYSFNFGFRENLITRLTHSGTVIGFFVMYSKVQGHFTDRDVQTLQSLSSLLAVALKNILANHEIEKLSKQLEQDNLYLNEEIKSNYNFEEIIGESLPLQEVFKKAVQVAHVDSTVLILGETGTGKELIARAIHNLSARKSRPLIKVNCAALPAQLIESELFGHEKGSFTGATDKRTGKFELAHGSTIFLDEIGELPLELQAKLLRVLQEKEIERIGGEKSIKVDVRIIAATNRSLDKEVAAGKFRSDLYYRLNIYPIELPPLRERKDDIPLLASFFLRKLSHKLGKKISSISPSAMDELVMNEWPGNIRELEHTIERSMLLTTGKTITTLSISKPLIIETAPAKKTFEPKKLADNEKECILKTLKYTKGKIRGVGGAAELLDILPTTLEARMKKLGIRKEFLTE